MSYPARVYLALSCLQLNCGVYKISEVWLQPSACHVDVAATGRGVIWCASIPPDSQACKSMHTSMERATKPARGRRAGSA